MQTLPHNSVAATCKAGKRLEPIAWDHAMLPSHMIEAIFASQADNQPRRRNLDRTTAHDAWARSCGVRSGTVISYDGSEANHSRREMSRRSNVSVTV